MYNTRRQKGVEGSDAKREDALLSQTMIDDDPALARTLPSKFYTDPAIYHLQLERIFARTWQFFGHESEAPAQVGAVPIHLLPGSLDEPLVWTREPSGRTHLLSNVCTHRGMLVVNEACAGKRLRCPYHGRRFGLDGRFQSAPGFAGVGDFPSKTDDLPELETASWAGFHFTQLAASVSFEDQIGPMKARLEFLDLAGLEPMPERSRDYLVECNWALYCDNYLEGFHVPFVHAGLATELSLPDYRVELHQYGSTQIGVASRPDVPVFEPPPGHPDHDRRVAGYYVFIFPNLMFNWYPWGLSLNWVQPLGYNQTRVCYRSYLLDGEHLERGAGQDLHRVELEDEMVVQLTQRGVRSRFYDRGRYSVEHERGVHHFHRLMLEFLRATSD